VQGPIDPATGMLVDLEWLDRTVHSVIDQLHLRHLDREISAFADRPSTAENIIVYLWNELAPLLEGRLALLRLWETRKNIFSYAGPSPVQA
jgi:6-pyruvoyltetrahydropterin/6-carboxytetrahydropterin synthase